MKGTALMTLRGCGLLLLAAGALLSWKVGLAADTNKPSAAPAAPPQPRSGLFKPGYHFVPSSIGPLTGYAVSFDAVELGDRAGTGVFRKVTLSNGSVKLSVNIGLTQSSSVPVSAVAAEFNANSQQIASERFVSGSSLGMSIGDQSFVDPDSTPSNIPGEILFVRGNIAVLVVREESSTINLKPIAEAIDAQIAALPDLTESALNSGYVPNISTFSAASLNIAVAEETNLTLSATDPQGAPWTAVYLSPDGGVLSTPPPLRYKAGSKVGTQNLAAVVYNPSLLFDDAALTFNVTP